MTDIAIEAHGLHKRYGDVVALDGVDLSVPEGTILGLLGPNGAGKTTAVRVLTTLLRPDQGSARVAGVDVLDDPGGVRKKIGLAGQYAAVDENLTGVENLVLVGQLYHLGRAGAKKRAHELLENFDLTDAGGRLAKTYSGGMRRRLDLAAALVADPPVLFLDEPTTGLDPRARISVWELVERLVGQGTTVLLTTQYLDEADRLADTIAVIDHGRVIAGGTSDELKAQVGGERIFVTLHDTGQADAAIAALAQLGQAERDDGVVALRPRDPNGAVARTVRELDGRGIDIDDVSVRRPTLDDVFLSLTGRRAELDDEGDDADGEREEQAA